MHIMKYIFVPVWNSRYFCYLYYCKYYYVSIIMLHFCAIVSVLNYSFFNYCCFMHLSCNQETEIQDENLILHNHYYYLSRQIRISQTLCTAKSSSTSSPLYIVFHILWCLSEAYKREKLHFLSANNRGNNNYLNLT